MDADADREGDSACRRGPVQPKGRAAKEDAHRQSFGNVVQGDGQHEQSGAMPIRLRSFCLVFVEVDVEVWGEFVQRIDEQGPEAKPDGRWPHLGEALTPRHVNRRSKQRPKTRRHHHPACEAQHAVKQAAIHGLEREHQGGTRGRHRPRKQRRHKGRQHRTEPFKPFNQCFHRLRFCIPSIDQARRQGGPQFVRVSTHSPAQCLWHSWQKGWRRFLPELL